MDEILVERHDGWRKVILNRPAKLNAVTADMLRRLLAAIDAAEADATCRAVMLTGAGRGFCAGQELGPDVTPGPNGPPDLQKLADTFHHEVVRRMRGSRLPFICAVNGVAAGAGASFALAGDMVLAARSAVFVQAFIRIGLVPDSGASFFLPRLVGDARARALAMLGDAVDAETAERWAMIWKAVDDADLASHAEALAVRLADAPAAALAAIKRLFAATPHNTLHQQLDLEASLQGEAGRSADFAEGVRAFQEKRAPRFQQRGQARVLPV
jgi:2-(1,2-epoxy-1,2-dihydrophenyl)acetyl-CoA isomerase